MKTINLKDFYSSIYSTDCLCDVPDEVAELLLLFRRLEQSQRRLIYKHKAYYSLNRNDGIENAAIIFAPSPQELFEQKIMQQELYAAIHDLPDKQFKRLYAHFFLDMNYVQIAKLERVHVTTVHKSINRALIRLRKKVESSLAFPT
jgi:RNA polymerase sigma-70 factor (ECF subfamily)